MTQVKYKKEIKGNLLHFPDRLCTIAYAADFLGVSRYKIERLIEEDKVIWEQPSGKRVRYIDFHSLARLKHPEITPNFEPLTIGDSRLLQEEIDKARHRIADAAGLPPAAVKVYFDLG